MPAYFLRLFLNWIVCNWIFLSWKFVIEKVSIITFFLLENLSKGWCCDKASHLAPCNASILCRCWFKSWLFHFQATSLRMALEKRQKMVWLFGSLPCMWKIWTKLLAPGFLLVKPQLLQPSGNEQADARSVSVSLLTPLCVCPSQVNESS